VLLQEYFFKPVSAGDFTIRDSVKIVKKYKYQTQI